jgi:hypothetical protein
MDSDDEKNAWGAVRALLEGHDRSVGDIGPHIYIEHTERRPERELRRLRTALKKFEDPARTMHQAFVGMLVGEQIARFAKMYEEVEDPHVWPTSFYYALFLTVARGWKTRLEMGVGGVEFGAYSAPPALIEPGGAIGPVQVDVVLHLGNVDNNSTRTIAVIFPKRTFYGRPGLEQSIVDALRADGIEVAVIDEEVATRDPMGVATGILDGTLTAPPPSPAAPRILLFKPPTGEA